MKNCYLRQADNTPLKARFPVIDAHNHLWGNWQKIQETVQVMDEVGVACYCDLTSNVHVRWVDGGCEITPGRIEEFFANAAGPHPHRFYGFTMAEFVRRAGEPLFSDCRAFVEASVATLRQHVRMGARGLKVLKELGLRHRDSAGNLVQVDDERLAPIWDEAGRLGVPVLIHQSDPYGFFQPVTPENEHYDSLLKYHDWRFSGAEFPSKESLLQRRDRLVRNHPGTIFMLPHVANYAENLDYVSSLIDENPNVYIDFSARCDELGRQPYSAREFLIRHQDRVYFGSDMPVSAEMYRFHFRFLETFDEYFIPPDYDGTFGRHRWRVHGLGLPEEVLRKIYYENTLKLIPGLKDDYAIATAGNDN